MRGYIKSPCLKNGADCPYRNVTLEFNCHTTCPEFIAYQEENLKAIQTEIEGRRVAAEIKRVTMKSIASSVKRRNK